MEILAHRGFWCEEDEKNQLVAFERAFINGFGVETDIRDNCGELVISHDMAFQDSLRLSLFLKMYSDCFSDLDRAPWLALNIKSDGLQQKLLEQLNSYNIKNYFVFDMSVPDGLQYLAKGLRVFTRESEYEPQPAFYEKAEGVWLDCFHSEWFNNELICGHLNKKKSVCIVSPELHKRDHHKFWVKIGKWDSVSQKDFMLCTDYPQKAREWFDEKN